jgi:dephospho-CoA kinase
MIVLGITGTLGAGKGTVVDYLQKEKGFLHFSVRAFLQEEIARRGIKNNRDSMVFVANTLRAQNAPSYVVDQLYNRALKSGQDCIIESIRTLGEIDSMREKAHFFLIAIDAEAAIRYQRIKKRASETDHISFETFLENEAREMNNSDPNKQNISKCIEKADFKIDNNSDIRHLELQIEKILKEIR